MHFSDLKYLLAYLGPALVFLGLYYGGYWSFSAFLFAFVLVPVVELLLPAPVAEGPVEHIKRRVYPFFDFMLYLNLPIVYGMVFLYAYVMSLGEISVLEVIGHTLGVGIFIGASGINVAHELGHRSNRLEIWMSKILLVPALYQHFYIEHNRGHHRYVATHEDPATARIGENLYHFWIRSTLGGIRNAGKLEKIRLQNSSQKTYSVANQMLQFVVIQSLYLGLIFYLFGAYVMILIILVAIIGFLMLESINYIEHYGLLRMEKENGRYETVSMKHSWNSNHDLGRILLYELTRHAHHHYKASKKYQLLKHFEESPQLPTGYPGCIILAMIPSWWFKLMNKRVPAQMTAHEI